MNDAGESPAKMLRATFRLGGRTYGVDIGEVLVATALLGAVLWHFYVTVSASSRFTNLMMVVPATVLFGVLYLLLVWNAVFRIGDGAEAPRPRPPVGQNIVWLMVAFGLYVAALPVLGFDVGSAILTAVYLLLLGERRLPLILGYSAAVGATIGLLMVHALSPDAPTIFF
jgi:hypothetical protein